MNLWDALRNSGKVIKEGLITPNEFNKPAADRFKASALPMLGVPGAVAETADELYKGNPGMAALAATGIVPGIGALGTFIGKGAKNGMWDIFAAEEAARLLRKGNNPHPSTGVHQGAEGKLRQEIDDSTSFMNPDALARLNAGEEVLTGQLYNHPDLYKAYPDIANMPVTATPNRGSAFQPKTNRFQLDTLSNTDLRVPMLHEVQHKIQEVERWGKGGNPGMFTTKYPEVDYDATGISNLMQKYGVSGDDLGTDEYGMLLNILNELGNRGASRAELGAVENEAKRLLKEADLPHQQYRRLAGEVESRLTQNRLRMNKWQRRGADPVANMEKPIARQLLYDVERSVPPPDAIAKQLRKSK